MIVQRPSMVALVILGVVTGDYSDDFYGRSLSRGCFEDFDPERQTNN